MDGTVLGPDHQLSQLTKNTLKTLSVEHRVPIVFAIGRIHYDVSRVADNLITNIQDGVNDGGISTFPGAALYLATSSGAVIHNALTGALLRTACLDAAFVEEMHRFLHEDENSVNTYVSQRDGVICRLDWPHMNDHYVVSGMRCLHCPDPPTSSACSGNETKAQTVYDESFEDIINLCIEVTNAELPPPVVKAFHECFGDRAGRFLLTFSTNSCMDIMAPGVSKGAAVTTVLDQLREPRGESLERALAASVAFGDGLNDESILKAVGRGFGMANANPKLIAARPNLERIQSYADDGAARTLRRVFGLTDSDGSRV